LGCDSVVVTEYSLNPTDTNYINEYVTDRDMVGIDSLNLMNQYGCDSLVIIEFLFVETPRELVYIQEATCNPEEIGISYFQIQDCDASQVGMEMILLTNQYGCDSVLFIETLLSENKNIATQNVFSCDPNQVLIDTLFFKNIHGCDSLVIRTNNYLPPDTTYLQQQDCDPDNIGIEMMLLSKKIW